MSSKTKTTATKEEATPALVPKLRFPEFRGAEGWEYSPLGKLLMKNPDYGVNAAAVPFAERLPQYLRITDISDDGTYLSAKKVSVDLEPTEEIYLDEGDIVLARTGASVGKSYRYRKEDGRLVFAGFLIRVKPNPKRLVSAYLANFLTTEQYWKWVVATSARSGQPGINSVEYSSLAIPLPADFPEQKQIAECLSSVDELMAAQARKVDALKTHKKGLMQQLFPREGETQPRLRFPEFQNAGQWRTEILGGLSHIVRGGSPRPIDGFLTTAADGLNWLKIGDVDKESKYVTRTAEKVRPEALSKTRVVKPGDLILSNSMSFGRPYILKITTCIHDGWIAITDIAKTSERDFLYYSISAPSSQSYFVTNSAGSGVQNLNADIIKALPVSLPSIAEQQRIAACLSSLDALITAETQKHEALKTHKKGLMQQLFPSPEEVAG